MTQIEELNRKLKHRLSLPLPGQEAQFRMVHLERRLSPSRYKIPDDARISAVLVLLFEREQKVNTVLIERTLYVGVHSGQIAFPGGKKEEGESLEEAALREAEEETGLNKADVRLLGKLTELYIPPSNFLVHPFVGSIDYEPSFIPMQEEVEQIITVDIDELMDESRVSEKEITLSNGLQVKMPYYDIKGKTVWGATAMMLSEFMQLLREL